MRIEGHTRHYEFKEIHVLLTLVIESIKDRCHPLRVGPHTINKDHEEPFQSPNNGFFNRTFRIFMVGCRHIGSVILLCGCIVARE
jgi:hypothetical protein